MGNKKRSARVSMLFDLQVEVVPDKAIAFDKYSKNERHKRKIY